MLLLATKSHLVLICTFNRINFLKEHKKKRTLWGLGKKKDHHEEKNLEKRNTRRSLDTSDSSDNLTLGSDTETHEQARSPDSRKPPPRVSKVIVSPRGSEVGRKKRIRNLEQG